MFITVLIEGDERLMNTAHIESVKPYLVNDGETGQKVEQGCELRMLENRRLWIGNDYQDVKKQLAHFNQLSK